jgi:hypothetical protein
MKLLNHSLLIAHFSFFPFTFYLFAGAIRVALIFVLKSESLPTRVAPFTKLPLPHYTNVKMKTTIAAKRRYEIPPPPPLIKK